MLYPLPRLPRLLLVVGCLGLAASPAAAQQRDSLPADSAMPRPQQIKELISTGRRRADADYRGPGVTAAARLPLALRETPQAITALSQQVVADQAIQTLGDAARYLPGVTFAQGEGHRDAPTIRGNATTSSFYVDGLRDDVQYFRDLYATERLEAVKGPSALAFGRGVGGGLINRVSKTAGFAPVRSLVLTGGSFGTRRGTLDVGDRLDDRVAVRLNALYENSDLFRRDVGLERWGVTPTATVRASDNTTITASAEVFRDDRVVDRGVPSRSGVPFAADIRTFFGNPDLSTSRAEVYTGALGLEHRAGTATIRSRTQYGYYDKFYRNVFPGALTAAADSVSLSAYDNGTERWNLLHQTDVSGAFRTGGLAHRFVAGVDVGRQVSANRRRTGFFNDVAATVRVPVSAPISTAPVSFRFAGADANNRTYVTTVGVFVQDMVTLAKGVRVLAGLRAERFDFSIDNFRNATRLERTDDIVSPRVGVVLSPFDAVSFYGSWSVAQLPSSGEQFAALTPSTASIRPERFENFEIGAKADLGAGLSATLAAYQLDRTNTTAPSPTDPAVLVPTGSQRSRGIEADVAGSPVRGWQVVAGYAFQDAEITSRTTAAQPGQKVPTVPRHQVSLWNRVDLPKGFGAGLGVVHASSIFAAIDNSVTLPAWTRFDAALFTPSLRGLRAQVNVENLFDRTYYASAHNNNNITPGAPRLVRVTVATRF